MKKKKFFSAFLKQGKNIGAITPSSRYLVKKMLEPIDFPTVKCIVEFGPGTGNITHELLAAMPANSILLVFEINDEFCKILKEIKDPRIRIVQDSAENLELHLKAFKIERVDYIVSSLPFAMIPNSVVNNILGLCKKVLRSGGSFMQYQYSLNAYKKLRETFSNVNIEFTAMNIPPAFVFVCTN